MGSLAVFGRDLHTIPADQTYTLKAGISIKIGTKIKATGEYVEKCEALSYEGEVGPWKEFSEGFFVIQASTNEGYIFLFTLRSEEDPSYLAGTKTDLQKLKLENSIEWNEWR